jgi:hypothetical protein
MFDRNLAIVMPRQPSHVTQTIHEHRAPTDQSVSLLKEMQEKAVKAVEQTIRLDSNEFSGVVHIHREPWDASVKAIAHFKVNGRQHKAEVSLNDHDITPQNLAEDLIAAVSRTLAVEGLGPSLIEALKTARL